MILYSWGQILLSKEILLAPVALLLTTACEHNQEQICRAEGKCNVDEWFLEWLLDQSEGGEKTWNSQLVRSNLSREVFATESSVTEM